MTSEKEEKKKKRELPEIEARIAKKKREFYRVDAEMEEKGKELSKAESEIEVEKGNFLNSQTACLNLLEECKIAMIPNGVSLHY